MNKINVLTGLLITAILLSGCSEILEKRTDNLTELTGTDSEEWNGDPEESEEPENPDYKIKNIEMEQGEKEKTEEKLLLAAEKCRGIYQQAGIKDSSDITLDDETVHQMIEWIASGGDPVTCGDHDYNMQNYEAVNQQLLQARSGNEAETEFYAVNASGVFSYHYLRFKDNELTVTYASAIFGDDMEPQINYMDKVQVYQWEYTQKGWLIWEKSLSRNQEMDMHVLHRILPLEDPCREIAEKCIVPVSYFCNNLFLADWDMEHLDQIEFNDLFDFLYLMETGNGLDQSKYSEGIPREEFERIVRTYFDVTAEDLRRYARYDADSGLYPWIAIGPWNRVQQFQPFPEVVKCVENEDGTLSVYVEAVFPVMGTDCSFSHIVTIREDSSGGWVYCGNKVGRENARSIPQFRARREYASETLH